MLRRVLLSGLLCVTVSALAGAGWAGITTRVSVATGGVQSNRDCYSPALSADGRCVAFCSEASNLVAGDTNGYWDVFVHDRTTGMTTRVSVATGGVQANGNSGSPSISADGRYVAFASEARNLVAGDTNGHCDVFVHDRTTGTTTRVSVTTDGTQGNDWSLTSSISADGRYVAFDACSSNLVAGDTNRCVDIFVHDCTTGATTRASVATDGTQGNLQSSSPSLSADGRYVAFDSCSSNLVAGDANGYADIFVHDCTTGATTRASVATDGTQGNLLSCSPSLGADGRYVAFESEASNLVAGDTNGTLDVFVHDRTTGTTTLVSVATDGTQGDSYSMDKSISADGRYVAFDSCASNLAGGGTDGDWNVFVHDRTAGTTTRVSVATNGVEGNASSSGPAISADGRYVAFCSHASNLVAGDTNRVEDVFVRDTLGNAPPTRPDWVRISPAVPGKENLTAAATGATDANDDGIAYEYQWAKLSPTGEYLTKWADNPGEVLSADKVNFGDTWRVRARAFDGTDYSLWKAHKTVKIVRMVSHISPGAGAVNVPLNSPIYVSFRWPVDQASVNQRLRVYRGTALVHGLAKWVTPNLRVRFTPTRALTPGTAYEVRLASGIACTSGRVLGWGEEYNFQTAAAAGAGALSVAAAPTSLGAQVTVSLSAAATVRTVVCNIAGRVVAELAERELPAGVSSLVWNGRGTSGTKVPAGCYLVRVEAKGGEGAVASAMVPLQVR